MSIEQVAMLLANGRAGEYRDELDAIRAAIAHGNLCAEGSIRDRDVWVLLQGAEMSERLCAGPCQIVDAAGVLAWLDSQGEWDNEHIRVWHRSQGSTAAPHQEAAATMTTMKRAAIIERLGRRYPALESALDRPEEWTKAGRVPDRRGWYYLEPIEAECRARYGGAAPAPAADLSTAGQLRRIGR